jgi:hypothetical protein
MPFDALPERFNNDGDLLAKAKRMLMARGWAKGVYVNRLGGICPVVALALACGIEGYRRPTRLQRRLAGHLIREAPHHGGTVLRWFSSGYFRLKVYNDSRHTSYDDLMDMFDRAIERQDQETLALLNSESKGAA